MRDGAPDRICRTEEVDRDGLLEGVLPLAVVSGKWRVINEDACVVDQDVDAFDAASRISAWTVMWPEPGSEATTS